MATIVHDIKWIDGLGFRPAQCEWREVWRGHNPKLECDDPMPSEGKWTEKWEPQPNTDAGLSGVVKAAIADYHRPTAGDIIAPASVASSGSFSSSSSGSHSFSTSTSTTHTHTEHWEHVCLTCPPVDPPIAPVPLPAGFGLLVGALLLLKWGMK